MSKGGDKILTELFEDLAEEQEDKEKEDKKKHEHHGSKGPKPHPDKAHTTPVR